LFSFLQAIKDTKMIAEKKTCFFIILTILYSAKVKS
jgi:hypothetical protein